MITDEDINDALDRIARTPDGVILYLHLQKTLMGVLEGRDAAIGALSHDNGRRSFASQLMARMGKGINESGGRTEPNDAGRTERPITFAVRGPTRVGGGRQSAREFIAASDHELNTPKPSTG